MFYLTTHSAQIYLRLCGIGHTVMDRSDSEKENPLPLDRIAHTSAFGTPVVERRKEMFYLTKHSTHFIYGYMASGIW